MEERYSHQPMNTFIELQASCSNSPAEILQSSSLTSQPTTSTTSSSPVNNKSFINALYYKLLMEDSTDGLQQQIDENDGLNLVDLVEESDQSTVLHVAASVGQSRPMIELIVSRCPNLLVTSNCRGDFPVHVATRSGHLTVVETLVALADDQQQSNIRMVMLEKRNDDMNTCLHIALENRRQDLAEFLFDSCPQTFYYVNAERISPLYLAIKAHFWKLVIKMLETPDTGDRNPDDELLEGKSVLHTAIMAQNKAILEEMLGKYGELLCSDRSIDEKGRRALSYAAYIGFADGVETIVGSFPNEAYKRDEDDSFPIHMACIGGHIHVVKKILKLSERMIWLLNNKGQTILHVAAASGQADIVKHLIKQPKLKTVLTMKDDDGYTPLHLAVKGKHPKVVYDLTCVIPRIDLSLQSNDGLTALDIAEDYGGEVPSFEERLTWLALKYAGVARAPVAHSVKIQIIDQDITHAPNGVILSANIIPTASAGVSQGGQVANYGPKKRKNKYKDRLNTLLIIATLVATVTYASGFTVPGGYNNSTPEEGMATLAHKHAFQVFVISNTIAMHSAILAIVTLIWAHLNDLRLMLMSLDFALPLLGIAITMMNVAFTAGVYVVFHHLLWLRILVLVIGAFFLGALLVFFIPLFPPISCIKYRILRYVFCLPFKLMLLASDEGKSTETDY